MKLYHAKRLLKLAEFLNELEPEKFDIKSFAYRAPECGTICCAAGWAGFMPEFQKLGFYTHFPGGFNFGYVKFKKHEYSDSVKVFFGVNQKQYQSIFMSTGYKVGKLITPKVVATKIKRVVRAFYRQKQEVR